MLEPPTHTGVDDVHAHPRHVGHRPIDLILALTAVFISAVSLYVAIDHGRTERELVRANAQLVQANSWPFLQIDGSYSVSRPTEINLINAGIGPAKLHSLVVLLDGKPADDVYALLERCCDLPIDKDGQARLLPHGLPISTNTQQVMRPGQAVPVIVIPPSPDDGGLARRYAAEAHRISFRACYCSVFDTCWLSDLAGLEPRQVARCPVEPRSFNQFDQL